MMHFEMVSCIATCQTAPNPLLFRTSDQTLTRNSRKQSIYGFYLHQEASAAGCFAPITKRISAI